jgi:hypothetical protein
MPTTKVAMDEAHGLRHDKNHERQRRQGAEQRPQGCLTQTHNRIPPNLFRQQQLIGAN